VVLATDSLANAEQGHLIEPLGFRIGQPEDKQPSEVPV
jgi:hypothetical protein